MLFGIYCNKAAAFLSTLDIAICQGGTRNHAVESTLMHVCTDNDNVKYDHKVDLVMSVESTRRILLDKFCRRSIGFFVTSVLSAPLAPAHASGGATAGGAYLLSGRVHRF